MAAAFLAGGGVTGELMRAVDWARTPLGPVETWPVSLRSVVSLLLHARHPMFLWWGPELIQFYNDAYLPSFGAGKSPAAMGQRGADCWQEIWPIIGPQIDDVMQRAKASWDEDQLIPILRNHRIEDVYWTYGYSPVFDDAGAIAGTLVVCTETTARVLADRRARTVNALAASMALADDFEGLSRAVAHVLESAPEDVPFAALVRPGFASAGANLAAAIRLSPEAWSAIEHAVSVASLGPAPSRVSLSALPGIGGGADAFVVPLAAPDFMVFGLSMRLPFDDAYRDHLAHIADHVAAATARIEAQRSRAATQIAYENLLMQAPIAIALLTGPDHVLELVNPLYELFVSRNDTGKTYLEAFPEVVGTALPGILDRVYETGEPFVAEEYPVWLDVRSDGQLEERYVKFNLAPVRDAQGRVYAMLSIAIDVTAQVSARRVLEQAHAEREQVLIELESAARAKDEFLAMLGHELRNPLAPIVTALHLLKHRGDKRTEKAQAILGRQVEHLIRLVDDLFDVSKIARGKVELRKETLEIAEAAGQAVELAAVLFEQRNHRLTLAVPSTGLLWEGDPVRLVQIITNLLTNAARYTEPGGHVWLSATRAGDDIVLSVRDNGIGMAPETLSSIFEVFFQVRRSTDRAEGGLGLGLALVKSLVEMHGGSVMAKSEGLGQGTEVVVRLPAAPAGSSRQREATPPLDDMDDGAPPSSAASGRILVVDDNVDAADLLAEILRDAGHEVKVAYTPASALVEAARFGPDTVILDIGLPLMDGYELGARLRALPATAHCRLIAVTGYSQAHDHARSEQSGFEVHLVKPIDLERLLAMVSGGRGRLSSSPR